MTEAAQLSIESMVKRYSGSVAIGPVSLSVRPGEFFSLLGPSGCGKTTILRCIAGFESLSEGRIALGSESIHTKPAHRRNVGLVFQTYALFPHLTLFENVAFGLRLRSISPAQITSRVQGALELVELAGLERRYPSQLSGGQQQRAAIARAIVLEPSLILFDEPLSNLDQKLRVQLRFELRKLQRRLGMTSIFVTHDQSEALALSDRIAVLSEGRIEQIGSPTDIYQRPATAFVADFIGNANLFECLVLGRENGITRVRLDEGTVLEVEGGDVGEGRDGRLLIRPEHLKLAAGTDTRLTQNVLELIVEDVTYLGEVLHVRLLAKDGSRQWLAAARGTELNFPIEAGTHVFATVPAQQAYLLAA